LWRKTPAITATLTTSIKRQGFCHNREFIQHRKPSNQVPTITWSMRSQQSFVVSEARDATR
jgi:hypothetical protein